MGGRFPIFVCLAVGALALLPASALAQGGTTTSAGDQQYVDPLANTTSTSPSTPSTSSPAPTPSASAAPSAPTASTPTATTGASPSATGALPYTGLNIGLVVAIGVGLVAAGLGLRRLARRA